MSANSTHAFEPPLDFSLLPYEFKCFRSTDGRHVLTAISFTKTLLVLPLAVSVLCLGFQRWRRQRSGSSAATMTHSDFFTHNMAVMELIGAFGYALYYCSSYTDLPVMQLLGILSKSLSWLGQICFPILTCVEHYLAVVHPITYRGLRQAGGVRIRNITTAAVWLICFVWMGSVVLLNIYYNLAPPVCLLIVSLAVMLFCSLSVLRVLIRPRPGRAGGDRVQVDQSKRRAVRTMLFITAVLWLKLGGSVVAVIMRFSTLVSLRCAGEGSVLVFNLAGSLVLPLLFLQRAGKLPNCQHGAQ